MSKRREMWDQRYRDKSSDAPGLPGFMLDWLPKLPDGRLLDLAAGDGSVALNLPDRFTVCAADFSGQALQRLQLFAGAKGILVETFRVDLEKENALQSMGVFQSIIACRYKPSPILLDNLHRALLPGGSFLLATFNRLHHRRSGFPERLTLRPNELSTLTGLNLLEYRNGEVLDEAVDIYLFQKPDQR